MLKIMGKKILNIFVYLNLCTHMHTCTLCWLPAHFAAIFEIDVL